MRPLWANTVWLGDQYICLIGSVCWVIIDSDNELLPIRWQFISTWTNADFLSTGILVTNFRDIWTKTQTSSFKEMYSTILSASSTAANVLLPVHFKIFSAKCRPLCSGSKGVNKKINIYFHKGCKYNGQFLPNQNDQCSYYRCDFGDEPWYDESGNIQFVAVPMKCAHGTSTNRYKFEPHNPCGETSYDCGHKGNGMMTLISTGCVPGGYFWHYYHDALSKIPSHSSTAARSSNEIQSLNTYDRVPGWSL